MVARQESPRVQTHGPKLRISAAPIPRTLHCRERRESLNGEEDALGRGGRSSVDRCPVPNAATASRIASRTEIASISGGSPTALLPQTTSGSAARFRKSTLKLRRHLRPRRQFVGGRAGGRHASLRVPQQLLDRQPADALDEAAFDLAAVDDRRNRRRRRPPECRRAAAAILPGEAVHFDFGNRRAVGEIVERLAAPRLRIEVDLRRPVVALREQRRSAAGTPLPHLARSDMALAALPHEPGRPRNAPPSASHSSSSAATVAACREVECTRPAPPRRSDPCRPTPRWPTCSGPCRCAWASRGSPRAVTPRASRRDLPDLGVQPLAHLGAAVIHLHAAVAIDQHQRAGLVEERRGERDAELHRRDREAALAMRVRGVERVDGLAARGELARFASAASQMVCDAVRVLHRLAVVRGVALAIEIPLAHHVRRAAPAVRAARSRISSITSMPCGPPKPRNAVCEVLCVRHTQPVTSTAGSRYALSQWNMRAPQNRLGQIQTPAAVGVELQCARLRGGRRRRSPRR